jgi:Cupredoxin-like domain
MRQTAMRQPIVGPMIGAWLSLVGACRAEDLQTFTLKLKAHQFIPAELHVPAGKAFFLIVSNQEDAADEFEMNSPPLEKVIEPGGDGRVRVRPLAPDALFSSTTFIPEPRAARSSPNRPRSQGRDPDATT